MFKCLKTMGADRQIGKKQKAEKYVTCVVLKGK